jgi:hypothetical protein
MKFITTLTQMSILLNFDFGQRGRPAKSSFRKKAESRTKRPYKRRTKPENDPGRTAEPFTRLAD